MSASIALYDLWVKGKHKVVLMHAMKS